MSDTSSSKLTSQRVKIADGYYCDQKLRIGGILFLEEHTGKGFEKIADDLQEKLKAGSEGSVSVSNIVKGIRPFLLALMHQCHPDMPVEELTEAINQLELDEFMALFNKLKLFKDAEKNVPGPTPKASRPRQPVKRKKH